MIRPGKIWKCLDSGKYHVVCDVSGTGRMVITWSLDLNNVGSGESWLGPTEDFLKHFVPCK